MFGYFLFKMFLCFSQQEEFQKNCFAMSKNFLQRSRSRGKHNVFLSFVSIHFFIAFLAVFSACFLAVSLHGTLKHHRNISKAAPESPKKSQKR
jgi:hypothetical protein